ncbi:hypothetical protein RRG08_005833 [Elysia crispata]|uniref:Uncharacterized protein n=1 Tax=Elysia crispata TaxID=231223 RepID=A0AAE1AG22_9GAST|nr:hypothetical protein RRG08_005833 [Elysia crispata]
MSDFSSNAWLYGRASATCIDKIILSTSGGKTRLLLSTSFKHLRTSQHIFQILTSLTKNAKTIKALINIDWIITHILNLRNDLQSHMYECGALNHQSPDQSYKETTESSARNRDLLQEVKPATRKNRGVGSDINTKLCS